MIFFTQKAKKSAFLHEQTWTLERKMVYILLNELKILKSKGIF